jgi:hypothetical protein
MPNVCSLEMLLITLSMAILSATACMAPRHFIVGVGVTYKLQWPITIVKGLFCCFLVCASCNFNVILENNEDTLCDSFHMVLHIR